MSDSILPGTATDALAALLPQYIEVSGGPYSESEEGDPLTTAERWSLGNADATRSAEFASGRRHLRLALQRLGVNPTDLPRAANLAPSLPAGVIASVTHVRGAEATLVVAAVAMTARIRAVGIDAEETSALAPQLWPMFLCDDELQHLLAMPVPFRQRHAARAWCAKEAVGKAWALDFSPQATHLEWTAHDAGGRFIATRGGRRIIGRAATHGAFSLAACAELAE